MKKSEQNEKTSNKDIENNQEHKNAESTSTEVAVEFYDPLLVDLVLRVTGWA